ncbi:SAM-dependent methyltransferase [Kitasatospora sp. NPDC001660]
MAHNIEPRPSSGSVTVVGTGIQAGGQVTIEALNVMRQADKLLHLVADSITEEYLKSLNSDCESLAKFYRDGQDRSISYEDMANHILANARTGLNVCVALYGHPGVFATPSHLAIRKARAEGIPARMLPGVSAEDCLFADLGIDPGIPGIQSFEATDFLVNSREFDTSSQVILWQIGVLGDLTYRPNGYDPRALATLADHLMRHYGRDHTATIYEASILPIYPPRIDKIALSDLPQANVCPITTLYIPPAVFKSPDPVMLKRLGLDAEGTRRRGTGVA